MKANELLQKAGETVTFVEPSQSESQQNTLSEKSSNEGQSSISIQIDPIDYKEYVQQFEVGYTSLATNHLSLIVYMTRKTFI